MANISYIMKSMAFSLQNIVATDTQFGKELIFYHVQSLQCLSKNNSQNLTV